MLNQTIQAYNNRNKPRLKQTTRTRSGTPTPNTNNNNTKKKVTQPNNTLIIYPCSVNALQ